MDAESLLQQYGHSVSLSSLAFDAHGCARLKFNNDAAVNLEIDMSREYIHLYAVLGPAPVAADAQLYRDLLEANLFGAKTRGATLSIDGMRNEFLLCKRYELAQASVPAFAAIIENFAAAADEWQCSIARGEFPGATRSGQHAQPSFPQADATASLHLRG